MSTKVIIAEVIEVLMSALNRLDNDTDDEPTFNAINSIKSNINIALGHINVTLDNVDFIDNNIPILFNKDSIYSIVEDKQESNKENIASIAQQSDKDLSKDPDTFKGHKNSWAQVTSMQSNTHKRIESDAQTFSDIVTANPQGKAPIQKEFYNGIGDKQDKENFHTYRVCTSTNGLVSWDLHIDLTTVTFKPITSDQTAGCENKQFAHTFAKKSNTLNIIKVHQWYNNKKSEKVYVDMLYGEDGGVYCYKGDATSVSMIDTSAPIEKFIINDVHKQYTHASYDRITKRYII